MHRCPVKVSLVLTVALFVILSASVFAYENEPDDFRGIKWGTRIEELPDMELALDGGKLKAYTRKRDKMMLEEAEVNSVHYIFYKEQFYCVHIDFEGFSNFNKIRDVFFSIYGKPEGRQVHYRHFSWAGEKASITLDYDVLTERGELGYKYVPIDLQVAEDEKNRTG